jgi:hypothetical protein
VDEITVPPLVEIELTYKPVLETSILVEPAFASFKIVK